MARGDDRYPRPRCACTIACASCADHGERRGRRARVEPRADRRADRRRRRRRDVCDHHPRGALTCRGESGRNSFGRRRRLASSTRTEYFRDGATGGAGTLRAPWVEDGWRRATLSYREKFVDDYVPSAFPARPTTRAAAEDRADATTRRAPRSRASKEIRSAPRARRRGSTRPRARSRPRGRRRRPRSRHDSPSGTPEYSSARTSPSLASGAGSSGTPPPTHEPPSSSNSARDRSLRGTHPRRIRRPTRRSDRVTDLPVSFPSSATTPREMHLPDPCPRVALAVCLSDGVDPRIWTAYPRAAIPVVGSWRRPRLHREDRGHRPA